MEPGTDAGKARKAMNRCVTLGGLTLVLIGSVQAQAPQPAPEGKLAMEVLPRVSVTVLVDNMSGSGPVLGEWGVALLIETGQNQVLFDTGGGRTLIGNAQALEVDLSKTDAIVISHEHADHTRGLETALNACRSVDVFAHPAGFDTRYWKDGDRAAPHHLPLTRLQPGARVRKIIETKEPTLIREGLMVTGQIPRVSDFEGTGVSDRAFLDRSLRTPDPILDDQAVFFRIPEGVVVLLGCAHAGLVNTLRYVSDLTGEQRIYAIMGGAHLIGASPERMRKTVEALRKYDVQKIMLSHCTGVKAFAELSSAFPGRCSWPASGTRIQFGRQSISKE
jgi:7,8-dihydropterin-6-yl-methyl-4-(beta-D-ribofuranosyl)aminobenzene 5'-phosphate synthase